MLYLVKLLEKGRGEEDNELLSIKFKYRDRVSSMKSIVVFRNILNQNTKYLNHSLSSAHTLKLNNKQ